MKLLFLILWVVAVASKPHGETTTIPQTVEVEKQEIQEVNPAQGKKTYTTKELIEKIEEVNRQHGFISNSLRVKHNFNPVRFPVAKQAFFDFPQGPLPNPIFEYLNKNQENRQMINTPIVYSAVDTNSRATPEDQIPGQYIKRKITHHQTIITPGSYYNQMYSPQLLPKQSLENQTIENVKNIIQNQYMGPQLGYQIPPNYYQYGRPNRQFQWPFAQYFPITIKDPIQQIVNAFTSMVEYGQQTDANCADISKASVQSPIAKEIPTEELNPLLMDIEDLQITNNENDPLKLTFNFKAPERLMKEARAPNPSRVNNKLPQFSDSIQIKNQEIKTVGGATTYLRKDPLGADKSNKLNEEENIKLFSKDSTGNGIFIHKLKVRKGGVAIAGPGGIATAGSGGTAIVGPNGYAYTQPDSIAIAGTGSKVVAVDPSIDLGEIVANANKNLTTISPRLGKVVAIGPVVYYNKG